jgi:hypothetical protein
MAGKFFITASERSSLRPLTKPAVFALQWLAIFCAKNGPRQFATATQKGAPPDFAECLIAAVACAWGIRS